MITSLLPIMTTMNTLNLIHQEEEARQKAARQTRQNVSSIRKSCLGLVNPRKFHWRFV